MSSKFGPEWVSTGNEFAADADPKIGPITGNSLKLITSNTTRVTVDASGDVAFAGDISAAGGFREQIGPFVETLAASQVNNQVAMGGVAIGFVAQRAGSVVGISAKLSAALTGAGTTVVVRVSKNGSLLPFSPSITFTADGGETTLSSVVAKDLATFVANDEIAVIYSSGAISNTPDILAFVEVEQ